MAHISKIEIDDVFTDGEVVSGYLSVSINDGRVVQDFFSCAISGVEEANTLNGDPARGGFHGHGLATGHCPELEDILGAGYREDHGNELQKAANRQFDTLEKMLASALPAPGSHINPKF